MGGRLVGGHPDTRAESTIWTSFEPISAAERTGGLPWVSLEVRGWLAERQQSIWDTRMRQKRVPLARKCVKNIDPYAESRRRIPSALGDEVHLSAGCVFKQQTL